MPLYGTEYEVGHTPEAMSFEAYFDGGHRLYITPHLCSAHEERDFDHRNLIDITFFLIEPQFGIPIPSSLVIPLEIASALVEGIQEIAPYVQTNQEVGLAAEQPEEKE